MSAECDRGSADCVHLTIFAVKPAAHSAGDNKKGEDLSGFYARPDSHVLSGTSDCRGLKNQERNMRRAFRKPGVPTNTQKRQLNFIIILFRGGIYAAKQISDGGRK